MEGVEIVDRKYAATAAAAYCGLGVVRLTPSFVLPDLLTPEAAIRKGWVKKQNLGVAIVLGAIAYEVATIIASAIHG